MIRTTRRDHVLIVTIDRPERRNALDHDALAGLEAALAEAHDGDTRVLALTGSQGHFCSGADLTTVEDDEFVAALGRVLRGIREAPFPTLAVVEGFALGAGTQLAIACDLRVATAQASFGIPAGRLGLAVDTWTVERLAMLAGHGPARAMLLAAEVVKGDEAHRLGLVQRIGTLDEALGWADEIAALAPLTLRAHKAALENLPGASDAVARAWASQDLQEGLDAFRSRRRPVFHAR